MCIISIIHWIKDQRHDYQIPRPTQNTKCRRRQMYKMQICNKLLN
uniref:Uncharacterized protein n=1 Tax=Arundo donax TaxID=35708 RepID=A0A0A9HK37_ARUDO